jgi:hypothetical protein
VKFKLPGDEFSHVGRDHETVRLRPDSNGYVTVTDEELSAVLLELANDPDHPIKLAKEPKAKAED